jgi:adenylate kinase
MGRVFLEYGSKGKLVPDEFTVKLWCQYIQGMAMVNQFHPETEILVLDGIPRNPTQAKLLDDSIEVIKVIHLMCADLAKMTERLRRRALKENRIDDANDEVIQQRLLVYDIETKPVLDYYPPEKIARVDSTMSQVRVLQEIIKILVPLKEQMDSERELENRFGQCRPKSIEAAGNGQAAKPPGETDRAKIAIP